MNDLTINLVRNQRKCNICGTNNSGTTSKRTNLPIWRKDKNKGMGFVCHNCDNRIRYYEIKRI